MSDVDKTDKEILEDRQSRYGDPVLCFSAWGEMCRILDAYAENSNQDPINEAHLSALKMVLLKTVRSVWSPDLEDNYKDGRNYLTIAERCSREKKLG